MHISPVNAERGAFNGRSKVALAVLAALAFGLVDPTISVDGAVVRSRTSVDPIPRPAPSGDVACDGVVVQPGTDIQAAIDARPTGATFCLMPGVHRLLRGLRPKEDQRFIGEPGAVVSGSKVVPSWTLEGGF